MSTGHPQARTTPRTRADIRSCQDAFKIVAKRFKTTVSKVRNWHSRDHMQDRSHRTLILKTVLSAGQEMLVVKLRRMLLLPLDDLMAITREFINSEVLRSSLNRCLVCHGVATLTGLMTVVDGGVKPTKTFKNCRPRFMHIDIKYLPPTPDETSRRYFFVAINRAARWCTFGPTASSPRPAAPTLCAA